jgi:hypothetical protein
MGGGGPEGAAFAPVTLEQAQTILGSAAEGLEQVSEVADEMYLVVIRGEFTGERFSPVDGSGAYLTFISTRDGETWSASHFVLSKRGPATEGLPQELIPFDLPATADPTIASIRDYAVATALWFLAPLLLLAAAIVLAPWSGRWWSRCLAVTAAVVAAGLQITLFALSVRGVNDAAFIAIKGGILAVALLVDAAAAVAGLLSGRRRWRIAAIALLIGAAALYLLALPYLSTTGA